MQNNNNESLWMRLQRGQALSEYIPTFPAAIMIMIGASLITGILIDSFQRTVDILTPGYGLPCEAEDTSHDEGPLVAHLGPHKIELTARVYDPVSNTTSVTYKVSSADQPSISHWTLAIPRSIFDNIIEVSENNWSWTDADPWTGTAGIKFDDGYEHTGGGGPGGPPGGRPPGQSNNGGIVLASFNPAVPNFVEQEEYHYVSREVTLLISGQYEWGPTEVSVKAGQETYYTSISGAPVHVAELDEVCE
jgi:hypothetical protein